VPNNPIIYYDSGFGVSSGNASTICPIDVCTNIVYENNTLEFDVSHFSTFVIKDSTQSLFDLNSDDEIKIEIQRGETEINQDYAIENTGVAQLNMDIDEEFSAGYALSVSPDRVSLNPGSSKTLSIRGDIIPSLETRKVKIGTIKFTGTGIYKEVAVYLKEEDMIEISSLDINVEDRVYEDIEDGDSLEISPGDDVGLEFDIENLFSDGTKLENVVVRVKVEGIDENKDIIERVNTFDLGSGESKTKSVSFAIPEVLDDDRYEMTVELVGDNRENNVDYKVVWEVKLKVGNENAITLTTGSAVSDEDAKGIRLNRESDKKTVEINTNILLYVEVIFVIGILACLIVILLRRFNP
jgi:hypothetical protein